MTKDEMMRALEGMGYRVSPPLTQDNCPHERTTGQGGVGPTGWFLESTCMACGKKFRVGGGVGDNKIVGAC